eukprot:5320740-Amphidinium_carterae.1
MGSYPQAAFADMFVSPNDLSQWLNARCNSSPIRDAVGCSRMKSGDLDQKGVHFDNKGAALENEGCS